MLPDAWKKFLKEQRSQRDRLKLTRKLRSLRHLGSTKVQIGSHEFLNFSSNDYLGLTGDLRIAEAAASAAGRYGWGTGASRLVTGSSTLHMKLESEIANFRSTESALLFGSGYQANLGVITALAGPEDTVFSDALNHASIVAGCKLSGANTKIFKHRDYADLEQQLNNVKKGKIIVVTDTLFSVEGDVADLPRIATLCERFGAMLIADDAHANACLGKNGCGIPEMQNAASRTSVIVGTFSKAFGSYGGFVACDEELREFLVNNSRPFIYTTAIPVALAAANLEALKIVRKEGQKLRQKLATNTGFLRGRLESTGFDLLGDYHIIGVRVGSPEEALFICNEVEFHGMLIHPMRWPTVPNGMDCLRISVTAAHSEEEIARLVEALKKARNSTAKKKTDGLTRRQSKRPTHQALETSVAPQAEAFGGFDSFDSHPDDVPMSASDSSKLPPPSAVKDFQESSAPDAGDTLIMNPAKVNPEAVTKKQKAEEGTPDERETGKTTDKKGSEAHPAGGEESGSSRQIEAKTVIDDRPENAPEEDPGGRSEDSEASDAANELRESGASTHKDYEEVLDDRAGSKTENAPDSETPKSSENSSEKEPEKPPEDVEEKADKEDRDEDENNKEEPKLNVGDAKTRKRSKKNKTRINGESKPGKGNDSGATLAPESMELKDPVIADIEGGTRKRKKRKRK